MSSVSPDSPKGQRSGRRLGGLPLLLFGTVAFSALSGCATFETAVEKVEDVGADVINFQCGNPAYVRNYLRVKAWEAADGDFIMSVCKSDPNYDELVARFITPHVGADIADAVVQEVLKHGTYTLSDGRVIKLVVEDAE